MTTMPKVTRYNTRPVDRSALSRGDGDSGQMFDTQDDGFGNMDFRRPEDRAPAGPQPDLSAGRVPPVPRAALHPRLYGPARSLSVPGISLSAHSPARPTPSDPE